MVGFFADIRSLKLLDIKKCLYDFFLAKSLERENHKILIFLYVIVSNLTFYSKVNQSSKFINFFIIFSLINILSFFIFLIFSQFFSEIYYRIVWTIFLITSMSIAIYSIIITNYSHLTSLICFLSLLICFTFFRIKTFITFFVLVIILNSILIYFLSGKFFIHYLTRRLNLSYFGLFLSTFFAVMLRNRTMIFKFSNDTNLNLVNKNKKVSEELLKALNYQKRFVDALDSECIDAFITIYQISQDLQNQMLKAKEFDEMKSLNMKAFKILEQNNFIANYLLQIIYKVKDHIKLNVKCIKLKDFLISLNVMAKKAILNSSSGNEKLKIFIQNKADFEEIECDIAKINMILEESIKFIHKKNKNMNLFSITLCNAYLDYKVSFLKGYIRRVEALKIIVSNDTTYLDSSRSIYGGNYEIPSIVLPKNIDDLNEKFSHAVLEAHYGYVKSYCKDNIFTQVFIIPKQLRQVRPKVMDL